MIAIAASLFVLGWTQAVDHQKRILPGGWLDLTVASLSLLALIDYTYHRVRISATGATDRDAIFCFPPTPASVAP